jgi:hypothetical protein
MRAHIDDLRQERDRTIAAWMAMVEVVVYGSATL